MTADPECGAQFLESGAKANSSARGELVLCQIASLLDSLECGALLLHRSGRIAHANCRLCDMMKRACGDLVGTTLFELYPSGEARETVQYAMEHFSEARQQEFYVPRPDGAHVPVIVAGRLLQGDPPLSDHRIITVIDISHQKNVERELQERYRDITSLSDTVLDQAMELKRHTDELERRVRQRTLELHKANMEAIYMLAIASEAKDEDTGAHVRRIERLTRVLALELGMPEREADRVGYSAILHDVGKIHVPDHILQKPGPLSDDEWKVMREHTTFGERILSREPFFETARSIARSHHENWDGSGYPDNSKAAEIPLPARIVRVADVYDALTMARPYKRAWSAPDAARHIEQQRGALFDPDVASAFLTLFRSRRLEHADDLDRVF